MQRQTLSDDVDWGGDMVVVVGTGGQAVGRADFGVGLGTTGIQQISGESICILANPATQYDGIRKTKTPS